MPSEYPNIEAPFTHDPTAPLPTGHPAPPIEISGLGCKANDLVA